MLRYRGGGTVHAVPGVKSPINLLCPRAPPARCSDVLRRTASNLPWVDCIPQQGLNVYSILQVGWAALAVPRLQRPGPCLACDARQGR